MRCAGALLLTSWSEPSASSPSVPGQQHHVLAWRAAGGAEAVAPGGLAEQPRPTSAETLEALLDDEDRYAAAVSAAREFCLPHLGGDRRGARLPYTVS